MLDLCDIVAKLQEKKRISFEGCFHPNSCVPIYFYCCLVRLLHIRHNVMPCHGGDEQSIAYGVHNMVQSSYFSCLREWLTINAYLQ